MKKDNPLNGPYSIDVSSVMHRNAQVTTIVNTKSFDSMLEDLDNAYDYEVGFVPMGFEHRPDLIANVFYGSPANWWLLMLVNGVSDPFEGFNVKDRILIPKIK